MTQTSTAPTARFDADFGSALRPALDRLDWAAVEEGLFASGFARLGPLIDPATCTALAALFDDPDRFRSTVDMARLNFGRGVYRYFAEPLPTVVAALRRGLYAGLAPIAGRMERALGRTGDFPADLDGFRDRCRAAGQTKPTPLLLRYGPGDFNCLHRDLYGSVHFPLQVVVQLSREGDDFDGGEFVLTESRARQQSRATVLRPAQGEAIVFAVSDRPARGARGWLKASLRHGVSPVTRGRRMTLGVIFHDAA